ncbi:MAG TPA: HEAT repeat domain-containing protein [Humisphaera sp.]
MAKGGGSSPDRLLEQLTVLRQVPSSPEFAAALRKALAQASPVLVARAAELCARHGRGELVPDLVAAYERTAARGGADADRQYVARTAVAKALVDLKAGVEADRVYLHGVRPGGGGSAAASYNDPAAELRAACGFGLVIANHRRALVVNTDLLADPAPLVRVAAARALAGTGQPAAALPLRLKLSLGDREPEVLAECVTGLMTLAAAESVDAAARATYHEDEGVRAAAAIALGTSRQPEALEVLQAAFSREGEPAVRKTILIAAASTRSAAAADWLIEVVARQPVPAAAEAIEALGPYRLDETVRRRVGEAVAARGEPGLASAMRAALG